MSKSNRRPTSPHLSIYRLQQGSLLSILTRITGLLLLVYMFFVKALFQAFPGALSSYSYFYIFTRFYSLNEIFPHLSFLVVFTVVSLIGYHFALGMRYCYWFYYGDGPLHTTELRSKRPYLIKYIVWISLLSAGPLLALFVLYNFFDAFDNWSDTKV